MVNAFSCIIYFVCRDPHLDDYSEGEFIQAGQLGQKFWPMLDPPPPPTSLTLALYPDRSPWGNGEVTFESLGSQRVLGAPRKLKHSKIYTGGIVVRKGCKGE